jgi:hypothetical protein
MASTDTAPVAAPKRRLTSSLDLRWFAIVTGAITFIVFGAEGAVVWLAPVGLAWATNRRKAKGERNYWPAVLTWICLLGVDGLRARAARPVSAEAAGGSASGQSR